jgi:hypothetical protein
LVKVFITCLRSHETVKCTDEPMAMLWKPHDLAQGMIST